MSTTWRNEDLPKIAHALARRPGHEAVRTLLADILRHGFGADYLATDHEVRMPEVRGRAEMLFGATVFELKRDLRQPDIPTRDASELKRAEKADRSAAKQEKLI